MFLTKNSDNFYIMNFNPVFLSVIENASKKSLAINSKLNNPRYLFSDIIKVLINENQGKSAESVNTAELVKSKADGIEHSTDNESLNKIINDNSNSISTTANQLQKTANAKVKVYLENTGADKEPVETGQIENNNQQNNTDVISGEDLTALLNGIFQEIGDVKIESSPALAKNVKSDQTVSNLNDNKSSDGSSPADQMVSEIMQQLQANGAVKIVLNFGNTSVNLKLSKMNIGKNSERLHGVIANESSKIADNNLSVGNTKYGLNNKYLEPNSAIKITHATLSDVNEQITAAGPENKNNTDKNASNINSTIVPDEVQKSAAENEKTSDIVNLNNIIDGKTAESSQIKVSSSTNAKNIVDAQTIENSGKGVQQKVSAETNLKNSVDGKVIDNSTETPQIKVSGSTSPKNIVVDQTVENSETGTEQKASVKIDLKNIVDGKTFNKTTETPQIKVTGSSSPNNKIDAQAIEDLGKGVQQKVSAETNLKNSVDGKVIDNSTETPQIKVSGSSDQKNLIDVQPFENSEEEIKQNVAGKTDSENLIENDQAGKTDETVRNKILGSTASKINNGQKYITETTSNTRVKENFQGKKVTIQDNLKEKPVSDNFELKIDIVDNSKNAGTIQEPESINTNSNAGKIEPANPLANTQNEQVDNNQVDNKIIAENNIKVNKPADNFLSDIIESIRNFVPSKQSGKTDNNLQTGQSDNSTPLSSSKIISGNSSGKTEKSVDFKVLKQSEYLKNIFSASNKSETKTTQNLAVDFKHQIIESNGGNDLKTLNQQVILGNTAVLEKDKDGDINEKLNDNKKNFEIDVKPVQDFHPLEQSNVLSENKNENKDGKKQESNAGQKIKEIKSDNDFNQFSQSANLQVDGAKKGITDAAALKQPVFKNADSLNQIIRNVHETVKQMLQSSPGKLLTGNDNQSKSVELKLSPEDLGKVKINIEVSQNSVKANFQVENNAVKNVIQNNLDQLKQAMISQGLSINSLNVSLSGSEQQHSRNLQNKKKFSTNDKNIEIIQLGSTVIPRKLGYNTYEYLI